MDFLFARRVQRKVWYFIHYRHRDIELDCESDIDEFGLKNHRESLLTTEYRVLPSTWYSAESSSRTEYWFSPKKQHFELEIRTNRSWATEAGTAEQSQYWKCKRCNWEKMELERLEVIARVIGYNYDGIGIQVLYSGVLWPHPARVTRLHHRWDANEAEISFQISPSQSSGLERYHSTTAHHK